MRLFYTSTVINPKLRDTCTYVDNWVLSQLFGVSYMNPNPRPFLSLAALSFKSYVMISFLSIGTYVIVALPLPVALPSMCVCVYIHLYMCVNAYRVLFSCQMLAFYVSWQIVQIENLHNFPYCPATKHSKCVRWFEPRYWWNFVSPLHWSSVGSFLFKNWIFKLKPL